MIKEAILKVISGHDLSEEETYHVTKEILSGESNPVQTSSFLTGLRMKGIKGCEIIGAVKAIRENLPVLSLKDEILVIDREEINLSDEIIYNTFLPNGSGTRTFSISIATAFVLAGCGVKVARAGVSLSSDMVSSERVLQSLGIKTQASKTTMERCIEQLGVGFFYTPILQGFLGNSLQVQSQIGIRTLLSMAFPLCNPVGTSHLFLGTYEQKKVEEFINIFKEMKVKHGICVYGEDTLDEASITGKTYICEADQDNISLFEITPEDVGLRRARSIDIIGGDADQNAMIIKEILEGVKSARRDVVLLNAGIALKGLKKASDIQEGIEMAKESIDSGKAQKILIGLVSLTNEEGHIRSVFGEGEGIGSSERM